MVVDKEQLALYLAGNDMKEAERLSKYCQTYDGLRINAKNYEEVTYFIKINCDCDKNYKSKSIRYMDLIKKQLHGNDFVSDCKCRYIVELTRFEKEINCKDRRMKNSEITENINKSISIQELIRNFKLKHLED